MNRRSRPHWLRLRWMLLAGAAVVTTGSCLGPGLDPPDHDDTGGPRFSMEPGPGSGAQSNNTGGAGGAGTAQPPPAISPDAGDGDGAGLLDAGIDDDAGSE